jgi:hypothetical protein
LKEDSERDRKGSSLKGDGTVRVSSLEGIAKKKLPLIEERKVNHLKEVQKIKRSEIRSIHLKQPEDRR